MMFFPVPINDCYSCGQKYIASTCPHCEITRLRAQLAEARLSELAALGQAQDAYTAQKEAEARALRVGEAVRGSAADMRDELADVIGAAPTSSIHSALSEYRNAIRALDVSDIAKGVK